MENGTTSFLRGGGPRCLGHIILPIANLSNIGVDALEQILVRVTFGHVQLARVFVKASIDGGRDIGELGSWSHSLKLSRDVGLDWHSLAVRDSKFLQRTDSHLTILVLAWHGLGLA